MRAVSMLIALAAILPFAGCNDQKNPPPAKSGVEVQAPGVEVKSGAEGTTVKTPAVDVDVNKK